MISSKHRFHGHNSLALVYKRSGTIRSQMISLRYLPTNRPNGYRAAVVVSRKVHKSAVKRNKIRRRIYSLINKTASEFIKPYDLVFVVYDAGVGQMPIKELDSTINSLLEKIGILSKTEHTTRESHGIVNRVEKEGK